MLLTFLGLTLLFLLGLAFRWCMNRQTEDSTAAGSYSPPIGCYSKVGATIQFGSTWLFARQGALVARFPRVTLLLTVALLAVACCGFLRFRVTTDPVELWSDPNSRARLEKAYFDEHFGEHKGGLNDCMPVWFGVGDGQIIKEAEWDGESVDGLTSS
ncbi:unnamed protein product [Hydatigera taeniaeformis]|uniref:Protein FAM38B n=1 Tax=Hydatigena taeniaeformis TaxID=6205 RepID=A0A0R3XD20_HYDTA|nr:unnamed protein product [Hydatigera taeniaeformis]